jgi:hypothetical protein
MDTIICIEPDRILETWPPIYRGQERPARDWLRLSQVQYHAYSWYTPYLSDLYLRIHLMPSSPYPKSFILDICRVNPRQLAPTVGTLGVGVMKSTAFSLLANSNSKVNGNQISFGTVDFQLHPPTLTPVFASLDQEMDLTIESLNFRVGSLGSIRRNQIRRQAKPRQSQCQNHQ